MRSPPSRVTMEPCPPTNVKANGTCKDHGAVVSWTPSPIAETYHVVAEAADGHTHTCNTSSTICSLSGLHCDEQYTVFVTASHENSSSKASQNVTLNTGLCQPSGLSVTFQCNNQSAMLTWTPSAKAKDYYGRAQAGNGDMLYCHSANPSCVISGLECGTVYNFSVQASDGMCNSSSSDPVQIEAVPCPPDILEVQLFPMQEEIQVMRFTWTQITCDDTDYSLTLTGSLLGDSHALFELSSYWTNVTYFEFPLPCSSDYTATMKSRNSAGISNTSMPVYGETAPCPPSEVVYSGNGSFATISWNASVFAINYTVHDNSVTPRVQLCRTTGLSCSLYNIASTDLVITASNAAGESEATNVTKVVTAVRKRRDLREEMSMNGSISAPVLDITHATPTVIFIEWSKVKPASFYSLLVIKQGSAYEHHHLTVYGESIILTDLSPNSTYCFSVLAIYSDTSGPESEPICMRTDQGLPQ
ncbi:fibronectin type III domain-containing protein 7-like [Archocentrus centrarchus]|uniref:fibronectin type III domain-containing protein 7-like n=1 Tax=Archocentrus centrarchus TaxID=63155 RepID=UPI0011EA38D2|nr:fibronectin type III domain-containing protein 7-like [Archocentrus centrarchus]